MEGRRGQISHPIHSQVQGTALATTMSDVAYCPFVTELVFPEQSRENQACGCQKLSWISITYTSVVIPGISSHLPNNYNLLFNCSFALIENEVN